jgi:cytochrome P450
MTSDADAIEALLKSNDFGTKEAASYLVIAAFLGSNSILLTPHDIWKKQRSLLSKVFHHQNNEHFFLPAMQDSTKVFIDKLYALSSNPYFDVDAECIKLTSDVIIKAMFSKDFHIQTSPSKLVKCLSECIEEMELRMFNPFRPLNVFGGWSFRSSLSYLHGVFGKIIEEHRVSLKKKKDTTDRRDMVDLMLENEDNEVLTTASILSQCKVIVLSYIAESF